MNSVVRSKISQSWWFVALACVALAPASGRAAVEPVERALKALGGEAALTGVKTISIQGTSRAWDPGQAEQAGGEFRLAGDSLFTLSRDFGASAARIEWERNLVYPRTRQYRFTETVIAGSGYVAGIDTTARTKQSLDSDPKAPSHAMSRFRAAAATRELARTSPLLVLEMKRHESELSAQADTALGGINYPTVRYAAGGYGFLVMFDPASGLPARVRTIDDDPISGDALFDLVLSDWRDVKGVKVAHKQVYEWNGKTVVDTALQTVTLNPDLAAKPFEIPAALRRDPVPAGAAVPYSWVIRRQYAGTFLDSDMLSYDPGASQGLRLEEVAPGVSLVQGGSHNSMIVEMKDYLVVFDAPVSDAQSQWTIKAAEEKYPKKPINYLVLTHHHWDHSSGVRSYALKGATIVVGKGNAEYFRKVITAAHSTTPNQPTFRGELKLQEVADRFVLNDGKREVSAYRIENPHAAGMLIGYVPDAKLGFVADIWSPGRDPLPAQADPMLVSLVKAVKQFDLKPEQFAGGHGKTAPFAPLQQLVGGAE